MLRFLAADELDAAFCLGEIPDEFAVERLTEEEVVAAPIAGHPPHTRASPTSLGIGSSRRVITTALEQRFAEAGTPLRLALESGDPFLLRSLAARGFAAAILPRSLTALEGPALDVRGLHPAVHRVSGARSPRGTRRRSAHIRDASG